MRGSQFQEIAKLFSGGERWTVETGVVEELLEDADGHFAVVSMGAEQEPITVVRMSLYVGDSFGLFFPLKEGQEVPVFIPAGDTCRTPFTFGAFGANIHPVPEDVLESPDDVWLIIEEGQNVRIRTSGTNNEVSIQSKMVRLGSEADSETDPLTKWPALKQFLDELKVALATGSNSGGRVTWDTPLPAVPSAGTTNVEGK